VTEQREKSAEGPGATHIRAERGARRVGAGIIVSRVLGFVRGWFFARYFAAGVAADAYNAALKIPNAVRNLLGEGAISASFVPLYAAALERDPAAARALANALLGVLLAAVSLLTALGIWAAPLLTRVFAQGLDPETSALAIRLMRVLFPMTGVMVLSGWCLGVQNAHRRFFVAYASAALWSATQIALLATAGPHTPDRVQLVWWLSWATLAGALAQVAAQLPQVIRLVGGIRPSLDLAAPGLRATLRNFGPVVAALGVFQLSSLVDTWIASWLPNGAIASLQYAALLYGLPFALFGVATAAAALPELAHDQAIGDSSALAGGVVHAWARAVYYTLPSAVAFVVIGDLIVGLAYRSGSFGAPEQRIVHLILAGYAVGLSAYASARIFASAHHALQDYRTPLLAAVSGLSVSAVVAASLALPFRAHLNATAAIAAGSALGAYVNVSVLWRGLRHRVPTLSLRPAHPVMRSAIKGTTLAALAATGVRVLLWSAPVQATAVFAIPVFALVYVWSTARDGIAEGVRLMALAKRRLGRA
jgi:putative peptidoglycan lipid II flippase